MKHKIGMAIVCLHISAVLYLLVGLLLVLMANEAAGGTAICLLVFCVALAGGIEVVVSGLHQRKFWAWIAGLCIFGMYVPSLFLPLGALGLWGLLDNGSRAEFGISGGDRGYRDGRPL
jgi:hypothetical protein